MAFIYVTEPGTTIVVKNGDTVVLDFEGEGEVTIVAADEHVRNFRIDYGDNEYNPTAVIDLSTFSAGALHIDTWDYDPEDILRLDGAFNTYVDPAKVGDYTFDFIGADGELHSGYVRVKDVGERDHTSDPPPIMICFAGGTVIDTDLGPTPVESISVGNFVKTLDNGLQPVRWIGRRHLGPKELVLHPHLQPVTIRASALGKGRPYTDLTVSAQHRVRLADWRVEMLFGEPEVLVPAASLIDGQKVVRAEVREVTYHHLLFDRHEVIWSNGLATESLHPGEMAQRALADAPMPEAFQAGDLAERMTARRALRVYEGRAVRLMGARRSA